MKNTKEIFGKWLLALTVVVILFSVLSYLLLSLVAQLVVVYARFSKVPLLICRCGSLHWDGVQDGPELQVQIPEALCCGEVSIRIFCTSTATLNTSFEFLLLRFQVQLYSKYIRECVSLVFFSQVHEHLSAHLPGHPAV